MPQSQRLSRPRSTAGDVNCNLRWRLDPRHRTAASQRPRLKSSYLVAGVIGRLEATELVVCDGVLIWVIHRPGQAYLCDYALEVARFALGWLREYYDLASRDDAMVGRNLAQRDLRYVHGDRLL